MGLAQKSKDFSQNRGFELDFARQKVSYSQQRFSTWDLLGNKGSHSRVSLGKQSRVRLTSACPS